MTSTGYTLLSHDLELSLGIFDTLEDAREFAKQENLANYSIWKDGKMVETFPVKYNNEES